MQNAWMSLSYHVSFRCSSIVAGNHWKRSKEKALSLIIHAYLNGKDDLLNKPTSDKCRKIKNHKKNILLKVHG